MSQRQLVWFRNDLRCADQRALSAASARGEVIALVSPCYEQWREHGHGANKLDFWYRSAKALAAGLDALNIPLLVLEVERFDQVPEALVKRARALGCSALHFNDEYAVNERERDRRVAEACRAAGLEVHRYTDTVQFAPGELRTNKGEYYSVFTPFAKAWHRELEGARLKPSPMPERQSPPAEIVSEELPAPPRRATIDTALWPAGEEEAQARLSRFIRDRLRLYQRDRDFPALAATSALSAYLAVGAISARQCLNAVLHHNHGHLADGDAGTSTWVNELVWREFYQHILVGYPQVCRHRPFRQEAQRIRWRDAPEELEAWRQGRTGYPLIDAAMRQLVETGWMHNRLRMVTAMFLTKHLLIDWREGEAFFLDHLVDGELGANNGGWQWAASTGTDAAPYFRLFNPTTQSQRFDPEGAFIAAWLEGFEELDAKARHAPSAQQREACGYPAPIVDHRAARERALSTFAAAFKHPG
ncbi:deoxyribodipyrimidine photo-lyase [Halotalea alkalilenta]|uniref:deoxyribodipyrimidine photo-lyase n=1 Tax=Halotalea alkalilenta TaxID=376489 RepID=UPI000486AA85|nr:deoxyribodipyrimidine photo-lyase [Halotalea alkalilenta]